MGIGRGVFLAVGAAWLLAVGACRVEPEPEGELTGPPGPMFGEPVVPDGGEDAGAPDAGALCPCILVFDGGAVSTALPDGGPCSCPGFPDAGQFLDGGLFDAGPLVRRARPSGQFTTPAIADFSGLIFVR